MLGAFETLNNTNIPFPPKIFSERSNSYGVNIDIDSEAKPIEQQVESFLDKQWLAGPIINGHVFNESMIKDDVTVEKVTAPYDRRIKVGQVAFSNLDHVSAAIEGAQAAFNDWQATAPAQRAQALEKLADLLETHLAELVALCHQEAGKTIHDSIDEVREAVDFCRYYAKQIDNLDQVEFKALMPRHVVVRDRPVSLCYWSLEFPASDILGSIAALVAGNTVVAKPAEQTSLIAVTLSNL